MDISSSIDAYFHILLYKLNILLNIKVIIITGIIDDLKNTIYFFNSNMDAIPKSNLNKIAKYNDRIIKNISQIINFLSFLMSSLPLIKLYLFILHH